MSSESRKIRRVGVGWEMVVELLKTRKFIDIDAQVYVRVKGLPEDAKIVRIISFGDHVELEVASEDFSPIAENAVVPFVEVKVESQSVCVA